MTTNEIEKELRMLDEVLAPLYLEVEAGFAEDLHVKLAKFILAYGEKCREEERERIKEAVSIEIEAWFGAHHEMEKSFMSEDMIKQIVKRMEEV